MDDGCCLVCGSSNLYYVEGTSPTGVVAPDGGLEYRDYYGYRCGNCGALEEL